MATIAERIKKAKQDKSKANGNKPSTMSIEERIKMAKQDSGKTGTRGTQAPTVATQSKEDLTTYGARLKTTQGAINDFYSRYGATGEDISDKMFSYYGASKGKDGSYTFSTQEGMNAFKAAQAELSGLYDSYNADLAGYTKLYERDYTTAGIEGRVEELKAEREKLETQRQQVQRQAAGAARGSFRAQGNQYQDEINSLSQQINEINAELDVYGERYYDFRQQEQQEAIKNNPTALTWYTNAKELQADMDKLWLVNNDIVAHNPDDPRPISEEAIGAQKYLEQKYGITDDTVMQVRRELAKRQNVLKGSLAGSGFDYDELMQYEQRQKAKAEAAAKKAEWKVYAKEHPFLSSVATVLASPLQGVDYLSMALGNIGHNDPSDLDSYVPFDTSNMDITNFVSTVRGTVSEGFGDETFWDNVQSFLYNTGMSIADSTTQIYALGPASIYVMGMSAASNQAKSVIERGGTNRQALSSGLAAGTAEAIFERVGIENLLKPKSVVDWKLLAKETFKQGGIEASEEMLTEVSNILSDAAIMGEKSNYSIAVNAYMTEQGMSEDEAKFQAFLDCVGQVASASASGFISGGVMGGGHSTANYVGNMVDFAEVGKDYRGTEKELIAEGLSTPDPDSEAYKFAAAMRKKDIDGKRIKDTEIGRLVYENEMELRGEAEQESAEREAATAQQAGVDTIVPEDARSATATKFGAIGAKVVAEIAETNGLTVEQAQDAVRLAYQTGRANLPGTQLDLTDINQQRAYNAGQMDYMAEHRGGGKVLVNGPQTGYTRTKGANINDEVHLRGGSQWLDGTNPGRAVRGLEESAGRNQIRQAQGKLADSAAAALAYGRKRVSPASLGIAGGSRRATVWTYEGEGTPAMEQARQAAKARGLRPVFFGGNNLDITQWVTQEDGTRKKVNISARAYISSDRVFVRVDHPQFTANQLMRHEIGHDMIDKHEINPNSVRERIDKKFGKKKAQQLADMYVEAYEGSKMTAEQIWDEIICDSLGDMNIFVGWSTEADATQLLEQTKTAAQESMVGVEQTRGPPAGDGKMSMDVFPPYNISKSDANEHATRWAHQADVKDGDQKIVPYHGDWYIIEADRNADLRYRIISKMPNEKYQNYKRVKRNGNRTGVSRSSNRLGELDRDGDWAGGRGRSSASAPIGQQGENLEVQPVGTESAERRNVASDLGGNLPGSRAGIEGNEAGSISVRDGVSDATKTYLEKHDAAKRLQQLNKKMRERGFSAKEKSERAEIKEQYHFSMENPVEQSGNLVAVHNLNLSNLEAAFEIGGFLAPSVAVTRAGMRHVGFGDCTVVFPQGTIDPATDARNKIYGADAATPMVHAAKYFNQDYDAKKLDGVKNNVYQLIERGLENAGVADPKAFAKFIRTPKADNGKVVANSVRDITETLIGYPESAWAYMEAHGIPIPTTGRDASVAKPDKRSTNDFVQEIGVETLVAWYEDMLQEAAIGAEYTQYNAGEIVEDMYKHSPARGFSALAAREYKSIDQARENSWRIDEDADGADGRASSQYKRQLVQSLFNRAFNKTDKAIRNGDVDVDTWTGNVPARFRAAEKLYDDGIRGAEAIRDAFRQAGEKLSVKDAEKIAAIFDEADSRPVNYFEAKPGRVVSFNETTAIVVPDTAPANLLAKLKGAGVNVTTYKNGNDADRIAKTNSVAQEAKFSRDLPALERMRQEYTDTSIELEPAKVERAAMRYKALIDEYGAIPVGENPAREVQVPKRTAKDEKVSQTIRTILEAKATPEAAVPTIEEMVAEGEFSHKAYTDKQAMADAEDTIEERGYNTALMDWTKDLQDGEVSKEHTALGWALYNNAANTGDLKTAMSILTNIVQHQRSAAQALQATRILKKMSPEAQLYGVQRSARNLAEDLKKRYGKKAPDIRVNEELARKYLQAETQKERDEALYELYRDLGRQMPSRLADKWNAWRYLAMLGNLRTHVRNVLGNAFFAPVVAAKDMTATAIEAAVSRVTGGKLERTKGFVGFGKRGRELLGAAWADYANVADVVSGERKYGDFDHANKYIQEGRRIFKSRALEAARKGNSAALEAEDRWFSRPHYAYALAQYCKANGITPEMLQAANEGQKNTATRGGMGKTYVGKNLSADPSVYAWDFLTSLPDMETVMLPEVPAIRDESGRVDTSKVVSTGMRNARNAGTERDGKVLVRNTYTGKNLMVTTNSIRHGLNGASNRLLTNARLGAVIGEVVRNAVPINALNDKAADVIGTYAMASYATDSQGREFVAIVTVEQKSGRVAAVEAYDMLHSVSGRQKKSSQADTKSQSKNSIKAATISIADLLAVVKETHQSILSDDVLAHFGEERNPRGDYADKVKFSLETEGRPTTVAARHVDRALLDRARAYAIKEAQKATYRDTNALSQTISEMGGYRGSNKVKKGVGVVLEGVLPFRKTPANILARGLEYSPVGALNGIKQMVWDVKRGKKTGAEAIDTLSAGLTGSGLLVLGLFLAAQGLVRGAGGDDEEKKAFEQLQGHQDYALELPDGTSVTLDWLAPEALPFFVGVNLWEQAHSEGDGKLTLSDFLTATANVTDPLLEMSCLQSLNDVFDAVGYASSDGLSALPSTLASAATSYLTQGLPTLLGQAERSGEDKRMTTYTEKDAFLTPDMQYTLGRMSARLPGVDFQQIPYIDAWGREEDSGGALGRVVNNFVNPAYTSTVKSSPMEDELLRLYEKTGEGSVFPERAEKYINVSGERKDLTAQEYVKYATTKGQTAYKVLTALTGSQAYRTMNDTEKVEAVELVYDYANATAKTKVSGYKPEGWIAKAVKTEKTAGVKAEQYVTLYLAQKDIASLKDADGDTIANSKSLLVMEMVYNVKGLTDAQRRALFEDFGVGKSVIHYNKTLVQVKLNEMRRKAG